MLDLPDARKEKFQQSKRLWKYGRKKIYSLRINRTKNASKREEIWANFEGVFTRNEKNESRLSLPGL